MIRVRLTRQELADAKQGAALRWQMARASGVGNQRRADVSDNDVDLLGIKAEIATAKLLSLHYNAAKLGIDDGSDLWFGDTSIDVKATFHQSGRLLFKSVDAFRADCAILVTATDQEDVMAVVGGVSRKAFAERHTVEDLGHGQCCTMPQSAVWPIEQMWLQLCLRRHA